jgi:hypothetical protein
MRKKIQGPVICAISPCIYEQGFITWLEQNLSKEDSIRYRTNNHIEATKPIMTFILFRIFKFI